mmetsp:Transcript_16696/g.36233  ORF Transcript_16696/g.36233 Transcript_16696/m.36233 type:complete len:87 (-) Transcript_16696:32-292(-)
MEAAGAPSPRPGNDSIDNDGGGGTRPAFRIYIQLRDILVVLSSFEGRGSFANWKRMIMQISAQDTHDVCFNVCTSIGTRSEEGELS